MPIAGAAEHFAAREEQVFLIVGGWFDIRVIS
jgi:hypothetical protein